MHPLGCLSSEHSGAVSLMALGRFLFDLLDHVKHAILDLLRREVAPAREWLEDDHLLAAEVLEADGVSAPAGR
jgi:hypothetical protein